MKLICAPSGCHFDDPDLNDLIVTLYGRSSDLDSASTGAAVEEMVRYHNLQPSEIAWDLLSIALSVTAADLACIRERSPDGWTRQLEVKIAVSNPAFWGTRKDLLERQLRFLTTDIWEIHFLEGGKAHPVSNQLMLPEQEAVLLLSGGLDSLIGALDLVAAGKTLFAVSQITQGDKEKQALFAQKLGHGISHIQFNHNTRCPGRREKSQRSRSFLFLAYGVLVATALKSYHDGRTVVLYACENGFISANPPLTGSRLGSLSTRTTHPYFQQLFQQLLDALDLRVRVKNPYQFQTKGEMLAGCPDQDFLEEYAHTTTSCGRYARYGYKHCGRCLPCLIRRAAFQRWGKEDKTGYVFADLTKDDGDHARFDDVRAVAMALAQVRTEGLDDWLGMNLSTAMLGDVDPYKAVIDRGLEELDNLFKVIGVR